MEDRLLELDAELHQLIKQVRKEKREEHRKETPSLDQVVAHMTEDRETDEDTTEIIREMRKKEYNI